MFEYPHCSLQDMLAEEYYERHAIVIQKEVRRFLVQRRYKGMHHDRASLPPDLSPPLSRSPALSSLDLDLDLELELELSLAHLTFRSQDSPTRPVQGAAQV